MTEFTPEGKLLNLIRKAQSKAKIGRDLKIFTKINILLIVIIAIVTIIFLADVFIFKEKVAIEPVVPDIPSVKTIQLPQAQSVTAVKAEEVIAGNDAGTDKNAELKNISREEILGNLNLLGIITGDNNQAIVEDKALKKTFFLYKGDSLGELKVYDIKDSAVILEYKGEKIELRI